MQKRKQRQLSKLELALVLRRDSKRCKVCKLFACACQRTLINDWEKQDFLNNMKPKTDLDLRNEIEAMHLEYKNLNREIRVLRAVK